MLSFGVRRIGFRNLKRASRSMRLRFILGVLGRSWWVLGRPRGALGRSWGGLGGSWVALGGSWGALGGSWGGLGACLGVVLRLVLGDVTSTWQIHKKP